MPPQDERVDEVFQDGRIASISSITITAAANNIGSSVDTNVDVVLKAKGIDNGGLPPPNSSVTIPYRGIGCEVTRDGGTKGTTFHEDMMLSQATFYASPRPVVILGAGDAPGRRDGPLREGHELSESSSLLSTHREESWYAFLAQVFPSFMLAGLGMVGAGLLLDMVQTWPAFLETTQLFILVPALLGLKGNLEMTLASRLSTQANLGKLESTKDILKLTSGNMALLQCQSVAVGSLASLYAILATLAFGGEVTPAQAILLVSSSTVTASMASFVLGGIMIAVVVLSKLCNVNPDNVAIPMAAALGDLITLGLLTLISTALYLSRDSYPWLGILVVGVLLLLLPVWTYVAFKDETTRDVLACGWLPIISAMFISSLAGNILDVAVKTFSSIAAFQPLMNGVGGNLAAVQASRMSTLLHRQKNSEEARVRAKSVQASPYHIGASTLSLTPSDVGTADKSLSSACVLLSLVVPGHLVFMTLISLAKNGAVQLSLGFVLLYNLAALIQVTLLLLATHVIIHALWRRNQDPDSTAIPYVTSLGDLLGTGLLALVFWLMTLMGINTKL